MNSVPRASSLSSSSSSPNEPISQAYKSSHKSTPHSTPRSGGFGNSLQIKPNSLMTVQKNTCETASAKLWLPKKCFLPRRPTIRRLAVATTTTWRIFRKENDEKSFHIARTFILQNSLELLIQDATVAVANSPMCVSVNCHLVRDTVRANGYSQV